MDQHLETSQSIYSPPLPLPPRAGPPPSLRSPWLDAPHVERVCGSPAGRSGPSSVGSRDGGAPLPELPSHKLKVAMAGRSGSSSAGSCAPQCRCPGGCGRVGVGLRRAWCLPGRPTLLHRWSRAGGSPSATIGVVGGGRGCRRGALVAPICSVTPLSSVNGAGSAGRQRPDPLELLRPLC